MPLIHGTQLLIELCGQIFSKFVVSFLYYKQLLSRYSFQNLPMMWGLLIYLFVTMDVYNNMIGVNDAIGALQCSENALNRLFVDVNRTVW